MLNEYKWLAGRLADAACRHDPRVRTPPRVIAERILARRATHGARAALLAGLTVGAVVERGHTDIAEQITIALAVLAAARKSTPASGS